MERVSVIAAIASTQLLLGNRIRSYDVEGVGVTHEHRKSYCGCPQVGLMAFDLIHRLPILLGI